MKKIDYTFSSKQESRKSFQLASGYISETVILFEQEKITVVIQANGNVQFYDIHGMCIAEDAAPPVNNGREVYEEIFCSVKNGMIVLEFPVYQWIDNYPHCDGEHDRWDTRIVGYHSMVFDPSAAC